MASSACNLTQHLPQLLQHQELLEGHLQRCARCAEAAAVLSVFADLGKGGRQGKATPLCPDDELLQRYGPPLTDLEAEGELASHILTCPYCLSRLRVPTMTREEGVKLIEAADRELAAYELAKEIAEWFCREKYPEEQTAFDTSFEDAYLELQPTMPGSSEGRGEGSPAAAGGATEFVGAAFQFASPRKTRFAQIVALSRLLGKLRIEAESRSAFVSSYRHLIPGLVSAGIQRILTVHAMEFLRRDNRLS